MKSGAPLLGVAKYIYILHVYPIKKANKATRGPIKR